jgi:hypothetical protein
MSQEKDETEATPAGRDLRAWAAQHSQEVRDAADALAQSLWVNSNNPPAKLLWDDLLKRKAAFDRAVRRENEG